MKSLILSYSIFDTVGYIDDRIDKKTKDKTSCAAMEFSTDVKRDNRNQNNMKYKI